MTDKQSLSPARKRYLRHMRRRRRQIALCKALLLLLLLGFWEVAGRLGWIDAFIMSQPSRILRCIAGLYREGTLFSHIATSCLETVIGFLLGTFLGALIATLLWWSPFLSRVLEPYLVLLNALPKVALGPIIIVWVGAGQKAIILMALAISLVVTILEVYHGFSEADPEKDKLLRSMGATRAQIFRLLVFPENIPTIINSLKINVGLSWVGVIMGEFLVSKAGIGYLIVYGSQVFQMDLVMASILLLTCAAAVMYQGVVLVQKFLVKHIH